jgi:hypothetical protein
MHLGKGDDGVVLQKVLAIEQPCRGKVQLAPADPPMKMQGKRPTS